MYNSRNITIGLIVFVVIFTSPFLLGLGQKKGAPEISLDTPEIARLAVKECIEDTHYMRSNHMQLLSDWKVEVVREGNRIYIADKDNKEYNMSLQNSCLDCHSNKAEFCDACHTYSGIETPNCWTCHVDPKEV